jgi:excisionase family DNA binding protein
VPEDWLTLAEVADALGLHHRSVWKMARRGELPAERDQHASGQPYRVRQRDLDAFLERSRVRSGELAYLVPDRRRARPTG